jgi:outer membrane receptor protein involved in Fe transport
METKKIQLLFYLTLLPLFVFAQEASIKGIITDEQYGDPLVGATIQIKGTTNGTITDFDGNYLLKGLEAGDYIIKASFVGYSNEETSISLSEGEELVLDFKLSSDLIGLDQVIVTGVVNPKSALESSVAVTSIKPKAVEKFGATTTAEIFKSIPGIHSESTGGEGNANIAVRGVPVTTGGSKFLQLYEDGLPVLQFGDIIFGNADIFLRADRSINRIEAIRGGSASTFASNSPAGIINFISNTGSVEGGSIGVTTGIDYRSFRTDFNYGGPISESLRFNIGGFYRQGEGIRNSGYDGNMGGQIKANITKSFENGYVRVYFKHLNDRATSYMPMPVRVTGTGEDPTYESIENFDLRKATLQNSEFFNMAGLDEGGNPRTTDISDGMHPVSTAVGTEFSFEIGDGWRVINKNRFAKTGGSFRTLFPHTIGSVDDIAAANGIPGSVYTVSYANGANAGQTLSSAELSGLNDNGLMMGLASFDVDINSFDNFTNDFNVSKKFNNVNITLGYYKAYQQIATYWGWQGYVTDVSENPRLMNIANADSSYYMEGGVSAYGQWGLGRKYDMKYNIGAPYANIEFTLNDNINIDASIRYDMGQVSGYYLNSISDSIDVNHNGIISPVEANCNTIDNLNPNSVGYDYSYLSYSLGANYKIDQSKAVYARFSRGGRAGADRLLYGPFITAEGKSKEGLEADMITQIEAGFKYNSPMFGLMVTPYYASISEQNNDPTRNEIVLIDFVSYGAELEASARFGGFIMTAGAIYTKAEIKKSLNEEEEGNVPRRTPALMYNLNPSYSFGGAEIGVSLIGTTDVYSQNDNNIVLPAYIYMNAYASYEITKGLSLSLNVNNLLDNLGFTEMEDQPFTDNAVNYMRARPITGRSTKFSVIYNF